MVTRQAPAQAPAHDAAPRRRQLMLALAILFALLLLAVFDWNWLKSPVERRVAEATGREFSIGGRFDVRWRGFRPTLVAEDVVLGNAEWAQAEPMFHAGRVELDWPLGALLLGRPSFSALRLQSARLALERDAEGRANWIFRETPGEDPPPSRLRIGQLEVADGRFRLLEAPMDTDLSVAVESRHSPEGGLAPLRIEGEGRYRGSEFDLQGVIDSPLALAEDAKAYRIDLEARAGGTRARASGGLDPPLRLDLFDLDFELSGPDMADLYPLMGLAMPRTGPYSLQGRLARDGDAWAYRDLRGRVGDSDLAGTVTVDTRGPRPRLGADLVSKRLDFDDLAGFIGGTPRTGEGQQPVAPSGGRLFPTREFDLSRLRAMDADVRLRAEKLASPVLPLEAMDARLLLEDGDLRLDPLDFAVAGGDIAAQVHLDARQSPIRSRIDLRARRLELPRLVPKGAPESAGRVGARLQLSGRGNSVAGWMATADGEVAAVMGPGRISNLTLEWAGLDFAEALKFLLTRDKVVPVRCGYADFEVVDGTARARSFLFDTTDTLLLAEGEIDLGEEQLDLLLRPRPKDASPLSLRSPLRVRGSLLKPRIRPQGGPLLLRSAAAVALYAVAPPAALLALVETGPGEDADCAGARP